MTKQEKDDLKAELADVWFCITVAISAALFLGGVLLWIW